VASGGAAEIEPAIAAFAREADCNLLLPGDAGIILHRDLFIALTMADFCQHRCRSDASPFRRP
jgi:hypothetical protein